MCSPLPGPPDASTWPPAETTTCLTIASPSPVAPIEALEETRELLFLDPSAIVADAQHAGLSAERHRGSRACIANGVLRQVLGDRLQHSAPKRQLDLGLRLDSNRDLGPLGAVREPGADLLEHGPDFGCPEGHDLAPALELRKEKHVVHELGHLLDLLPRLGKKLVTVGSRKGGRLEDHEQPGQGGPELVRDSGGEADS